jgi:hypothetical protein
MTLVQFGHAALFVVGAVGIVAGSLAAAYPAYAVPFGATTAVCAALGTYLGQHLPSLSDAVNSKAVAVAMAKEQVT